METANWFSLVAVILSGVGLFLASRKDTKTEAKESAITQTKLDNLINGVTEIRVDLKSMRETVSDHGERLAKVEAKADNNLQRIAILEGKRSDGE